MPGGPNILNQLASQLTVAEHQFNTQVDYLVQWRALRATISRYSRFALDSRGHEYFSELGIATEPDAAGAHSHPVSKTLDDYALRVVVPPLLNRTDFTCYFMKPAKHSRLVGDTNKELGRCPLVNHLVVEKDPQRYPVSLDLPLQPCSTEVAFMGETMHFMTPKDIVRFFRESPSLNMLVGTVIVPVPLLMGLSEFTTPAYSYRVRGREFEHAPDSAWGESYTQPVSSCWLLECSSLHDLGLDLGIHISWSADPEHVVVVTRGLSQVNCSTTLEVVGRSMMDGPGKNILVPTKAIEFVSNYCHGPGSASKRTIWARLNAWCHDKSSCKITTHERKVIADAAYADRKSEEDGWYPSSFAPPQWVTDPVRSLLWNSIVGFLRPFMAEHHGVSKYFRPALWNSPRRAKYIQGKDQHSILYSGGRITATRDLPAAMASVIDRAQCSREELEFNPVLGGNGGLVGTGKLRERIAVMLLCLPFLVSFAVPLYLDDYHFLLRACRVVTSSSALREPLGWYLRHGTFVHFINLLIGYFPGVVTVPFLGVVAPATRLVCRWYIRSVGSAVRSCWVCMCRRFPVLWDVDLAIHMLFFPHFIHVSARSGSGIEPESDSDEDSGECPPSSGTSKGASRDCPRTPKARPGPDLSYVTNMDHPPSGWNRFSVPSDYHSVIRFLPADGDEADYLYATVAGRGRTLELHSPTTRAWEFKPPNSGEPDQLGIRRLSGEYFKSEACSGFTAFIDSLATVTNITFRVCESEVPEGWSPELEFESIIMSFGGYIYGVNILEEAEPVGSPAKASRSTGTASSASYHAPTVEEVVDEQARGGAPPPPDGPLLREFDVVDILHEMDIRPGRATVSLPKCDTRGIGTEAPDQAGPTPVEAQTVPENTHKDPAHPRVRMPRTNWADGEEVREAAPLSTASRPTTPNHRAGLSPVEKVREMELTLMGGEAKRTPGRDRGVCLLDALEDATGERREFLWPQLVGVAPLPEHRYFGLRPPPLDSNCLYKLSSVRKERYLVHFNQRVFEYSDVRAGATWPIVELFNVDNKHWTGKLQVTPVKTGTKPNAPRVKTLSLEDRWFNWCRSYSGTYRWCKPRARAAVKAFQGKNFGALVPGVDGLLQKWDSLLSSPPASTRRPVRVSGLMGEGGTGKSFGFLEILKSLVQRDPRNEDWCIIAPTDVLRASITKHLQLPDGMGYKVKTWEVALTQRLPRTIYLDDCGLIPPIFDLLLLLNPGVVNVFFSGDLGQNVSEFGPDVPGWRSATPVVEVLAPYACNYLRRNRRIANGTGSRLGVVVEGDRDGTIRFGSNRKAAIVTSTPGAAATFRNMGREAYTTNTCQGISVEKSEILVDHYLEKASNRALNTALYRSRGDVWINLPHKASTKLRPSSSILRGLVAASEGDWDPLAVAMRNHRIEHTPRQLTDPTKLPGKEPKALSELLYPPVLSGSGWNDRIAREVNTIPSRLFVPHCNREKADEAQPWVAGKSRRSWAARMVYFAALPWLWLAYSLGFSDPYDSGVAYALNPTPEMPYELLGPPIGYNTYEVCTLPGAAADVVDLLFKTRVFGREVKYGGWLTQQVDDTDSCTSMFLRHRRCDKPTEAWTFKERHVPPKPPATHYLGGGQALFEAFNHVYEPQYPEFSETVWEECHDEDLDNLLDKGPKALKNISYRADTSLEPGKAEIFLKGQQITKPGTAFRDAKKGQMITGFQTLINARFGAMSRYITKAIRKALPANIMLLTGLSLDEQETWFKGFWNWKRACYEDDFVAFDGTQNEDFLAFQVKVMGALGIPSQVIEDYVNWVTHLHGMLGPMGVFIASGFKPTWIFNTLDNMAFQAVKHSLTPGNTVARAFSGDDSVHNEMVAERTGYRNLKHSYRLKSKGVHTTYPTFCGTTNIPVGSFSDPTLLLQRVLFRLRRGDLQASALSYAEHCSKLNAVLPLCSDYLSGEQLEHHTLTRRILRFHLEASGRSLQGLFFTKLNAGKYDLGY